MSDAKGRFCWHDLMTEDLEAAKSFYTQLIGWETEQWEGATGDMPPYSMWKGSKGTLGGVMPLPEEAKKMGAPPNWLAYVATDDIDASVAQAKRLGGHVMVPPTDIPTVGKFSVLADPFGAAFALFTGSEGAPGSNEPAAIGEVSWHELTTSDVDKVFGFYGEMFGWKKLDDMDMGPMGKYRIFGRGDQQLGGIFVKPAEMPGPNAWLCYFQVADLDAKVEEAKKLGAKLLNGPMEVPGGDRIAQFLDPQGAAFALHAKAKG
jgi:predicted enzyme related to lactoylglutathione lyase